MARVALYIRRNLNLQKNCFSRYCLTSSSPAGGRAACLCSSGGEMLSCLSEWASWSGPTFLPGCSRISPVFVSHSSVAWPPLFALRSASTLQPRGQIQDSSGHKGPTSALGPPSAFQHHTSGRAVGAAPKLGPTQRTDKALCAKGESG